VIGTEAPFDMEAEPTNCCPVLAVPPRWLVVSANQPLSLSAIPSV